MGYIPEWLQGVVLGIIAVQGLLLILPPKVIQLERGSWLGNKIIGKNNGRNNAIFVFIYGDLDCYRAVLAEELWECEAKKPLHKLLWVGLTDEGKRWLELRGHEVNTQVAVKVYKVNEITYRLEQAKALKKYYKEFSGQNAVKIAKSMKDLREFAIKESKSYT